MATLGAMKPESRMVGRPDDTHVLVVEDSTAMRSLLCQWLWSEGLETVEAETGIAAIKMLQTRRFAVIVTDINMSDVTGLELIRFVRSAEAHVSTQLIVISTDGGVADRQRALDLGADAYLAKPFGAEELSACLKKHAARRRGRPRKAR